MKRACDIELTFEGVCSRVRPSLVEKIRYSIYLIRRAERLALRLDPEDGFYNTFSGGKDSQVLYHLMKIAGVKHKTFFSPTTIDPPEVIRFIRREYPDVVFCKPKRSIYKSAESKGLPTMVLRWCCAEFKEAYGAGKVTTVGIRNAESTRRAGRRLIDIGVTKKISRKYSSFDEFEEHEEQNVACINGKDKIILSPIIHWLDNDVWEFLNANGIPHCELYDEGFTRIGCIACPMRIRTGRRSDLRRWPHVRRNWLKTIDVLMRKGRMRMFDGYSPEQVLDWWVSGLSIKEYKLSLLQQEFDFGEGNMGTRRTEE